MFKNPLSINLAAFGLCFSLTFVANSSDLNSINKNTMSFLSPDSLADTQGHTKIPTQIVSKDSIKPLDIIDSNRDLVISEVHFKILNSFENSKKHSDFETDFYNLLHKLRFKTKQSTIERYLLFNSGDTVTQEKIIETERLLRTQRFLSDAKIQLTKNDDNTYDALVTTSDNWTTNAALNLSKPGDEYYYNLGLVEYDLLGYGMEGGYIYSKGPERNSSMFMFKDPQFIWDHHSFVINYMNNTDGNSFHTQFQKNFLGRDDKWGYTALWHHQIQNKYLYLSRTSPTSWKRPQVNNKHNIDLESYQSGLPIVKYEGAYLDSTSLRLSRSFGAKWKNYIRIHHDRLSSLTATKKSIAIKSINCADLITSGIPTAQELFDDKCPLVSDPENPIKIGFGIDSDKAPDLWSRRDAMMAMSHIFEVVEYKSVKNLNSTKWTEDLDLGFTIENRVGRNIPPLGARFWEWYFKHQFKFFEMAGIHHYFSGLAMMDYYLKDSSNEVTHGHQVGSLSYQFKKGSWSSVVKGNYEAYFLSDASRQLQLGGFQGLVGFPDFYYAGQSMAWFKLEQRYYPEWEVGTAVPVPAVFISGGNAWAHIDDMDTDDLEYAAGFGLRVGLSKSVLGIVNHVNFSWPLNGVRENGIEGGVFTLTTEANF